MSSFRVSVLTAKKKVFEGDAESLTAPAFEGRIGVLAHHAPLACVLVPGDIVIKNRTQPLVVHSAGKGFLRVAGNCVEILLEDQAVSF